jgi:hypothetical protein
MRIELIPEDIPIFEDEKIIGYERGDSVGSELFPESKNDYDLCEGLEKAYKRGDLFISIVDSCLVIEYDGIKGSFPISRKMVEAFERNFESFWRRELEIRVGRSSIWNNKAKTFCYESCSMRFVRTKSFMKKVPQVRTERRLISSYISPMPNGEIIKKHRSPARTSFHCELRNALIMI